MVHYGYNNIYQIIQFCSAMPGSGMYVVSKAVVGGPAGPRTGFGPQQKLIFRCVVTCFKYPTSGVI